MFFYKIFPAHKYAKQEYTYSSETPLQNFQVVAIEYGRKPCLGVCIQAEDAQAISLKNIAIKKIGQKFEYFLKPETFEFFKQCATYNLATVGSILELSLPGSLLAELKKNDALPLHYWHENKITRLDELQKSMRTKKISQMNPYILENNKKIPANSSFDLTSDQKQCSAQIAELEKSQVLYIHGVTGSGKTVVTLEGLRQLINSSTKFGKILIITPEVSLSKMWAQKIEEYLGIPVCFFHHKMNAQYKHSVLAWAQSDEPGILVGARSALFLPYKNLSAVVIDEEHSPALKQDRYPFYNARDMAILRGALEKFPCILLSATISLETLYNINIGKYLRADITRVPKSGKIESAAVKQTRFQILAPEIIKEIADRFEKNEQVILFLNRKGYAPYCICVECSKILMCHGCDVAKIFYTNGKTVCHKCDKTEALPTKCPNCKQNTTWKFFGIGVEKLAEYVQEIFPKRTFKIVTSQTKEIDEYIDDINNQRIDGLIATQVVAQGHDFKNVSLVVVVDADMGLNSPDFRAKERILQLWMQVSGRSGRHNSTGKIIFQTFDETSKFIQIFSDPNAYQTLMEERRLSNLPPFSRCAFISVKSKNAQILREFCFGSQFSELKTRRDLEIYGPLYVGKENYVIEMRFLIKVPKQFKIHQIMQEIAITLQKTAPKSLKLEFEIDPYRFD